MAFSLKIDEVDIQIGDSVVYGVWGYMNANNVAKIIIELVQLRFFTTLIRRAPLTN